MTFLEPSSWLLIIVTLSLFRATQSEKTKKIILALASITFYILSAQWFVVLLVVPTFIDFLISKKLVNTPNQDDRKRLLHVSIFLNLSFLLYYKYAHSIIDLANLTYDFLVTKSGREGLPQGIFSFLKANSQNHVIPLGLSFYTFQRLSAIYTFYKNKERPFNNFLSYFLYIGFFPQLIAGPILNLTRHRSQFEQLQEKVFSRRNSRAIYFILIGLVGKVFLADPLADLIVNPVFQNFHKLNSLEIFIGIIAYNLQLFFDFKAYIDICRGIGTFFGFNLPENFFEPYKATNVVEFHRNWHRTLMEWFRDVVYIPLGGSKHGFSRKLINVVIVFTISGLWHGNTINFLVWSSINALGYIFFIIYLELKIKYKIRYNLPILFSILLTFLFTSFSRLWFRSDSFAKTNDILSGIFSLNFGRDFQLLTSSSEPIFLSFLIFLVWMPSRWKRRFKLYFLVQHKLTQYFALICLLYLVFLKEGMAIKPFIYFQF